jgi:hypothetical protein
MIDSEAATGLATQAASDIGNWAENSDPWNKLKSYLNPTAVGEQFNYSADGGAWADVEKAYDLGKNADTYAGRGMLQDKYYGQKGLTTTPGEKGFDSFLVGQDANARDQFDKFKARTTDKDTGILAQYGADEGKEGAKVKGAESLASAANMNNALVSGAVRDDLTDTYDSGWKQVMSALAAKNSQRADKGRNLLNQYEKEGKTGGSLGPALEWQDVISDSDRSRLKALNNILGLNDGRDYSLKGVDKPLVQGVQMAIPTPAAPMTVPTIPPPAQNASVDTTEKSKGPELQGTVADPGSGNSTNPNGMTYVGSGNPTQASNPVLVTEGAAPSGAGNNYVSSGNPTQPANPVPVVTNNPKVRQVPIGSSSGAPQFKTEYLWPDGSWRAEDPNAAVPPTPAPPPALPPMSVLLPSVNAAVGLPSTPIDPTKIAGAGFGSGWGDWSLLNQILRGY